MFENFLLSLKEIFSHTSLTTAFEVILALVFAGSLILARVEKISAIDYEYGKIRG